MSPNVTPPVRLTANIAGRVVCPSAGRVVSQRTIGMPSTSPADAESGRNSGSEVVRPSHGSSCRRRSAPRSAPTTLAMSLNESTEISGHSGRSATTLPSAASGLSSTNRRRRVRAASIASEGDTAKTLAGGSCWALTDPFAAMIDSRRQHGCRSPCSSAVPLRLAHRVSSPDPLETSTLDREMPLPATRRHSATGLSCRTARTRSPASQA